MLFSGSSSPLKSLNTVTFNGRRAEDEQNRHLTGFLRDHARSVDLASSAASDNITKDIENNGVT